jgi:hypothetical protein
MASPTQGTGRQQTQQSTRWRINGGRGGGCNDSNNNGDKEMRDTTTIMMTLLPLPQTGRTTSTAAVKPFEQQSTFQASSGKDLEEEKWQMGRWHDCRWRKMDDWWQTTDDGWWTTDNRWRMMDNNVTIKKNVVEGGGRWRWWWQRWWAWQMWGYDGWQCGQDDHDKETRKGAIIKAMAWHRWEMRAQWMMTRQQWWHTTIINTHGRVVMMSTVVVVVVVDSQR